MKKKSEYRGGSELHRLRPMKEGYDKKLFDKLYKLCKPIIKNLVRQIDCKRLGITSDIVESQFWDKMIYVFNRYYGEVDEEHLKADIFRSLSTYKNKILRSAYGEVAEINKGMASWEDLFDDSKEMMDDTDAQDAKSEMLRKVYDYMRKHLSLDAQLVFEVLVTPPPYIKERIKEGQRITNLLLVDFFELPKNRVSVKYFSELREDIDYWEKRAAKELHF